jgi:hypothetical protein
LEKNTGSTIPGDLSVAIPSGGITSSEGDNVPAETNTDTTDGGELDDQLEFKLWLGLGGATDSTFDSSTDIGLNSDGTTTTSNDGGFETASNYDGTTWSDVITDFAGPVTFNVEWNFPGLGSTNNAAQGDTISVDFDFTLQQQ